ncbi:hypothetical protein ACFSYD_25285 [Paracoccus aerius]
MEGFIHIFQRLSESDDIGSVIRDQPFSGRQITQGPLEVVKLLEASTAIVERAKNPLPQPFDAVQSRA